MIKDIENIRCDKLENRRDVIKKMFYKKGLSKKNFYFPIN